MNIGFLGLGIMGSRMAANLIKAGHRLTVWNRTAEKAGPLTALGARQAATPQETARGSELVITMLADPRAVERAALGPDGFLQAMAPGTIWMDSSTVKPSFSRARGEEASLRGVRFVDAPVTGSKEAAEKGQLVFLVGGEPEVVDTLRPLMEKMGKAITYAGETGMGSSLKIVNNMLVGESMLAFSEGLVLGESLGFDRKWLFDFFTGSAAISQLVVNKRSKIEPGSYEADFPLQWLQKDLEMVSETAYEQGIALPAANAAKAVYMLAARYGLAEEDFSAIYRFLSEQQKPGSDQG